MYPNKTDFCTVIKVAVFDDNKPRRELLEMLLNSTENMQCTGAFEDCRDVLKNIVQNVPDVVLMDIDMPYVNGIEGLQLIKKQFPQVRILMQTVFEDDEKIFAAICAGADGYILKKTPPAMLIDAISECHVRRSSHDATVARQVLQLFNNRNKKSVTEFNLTERETEILSMLVQGLSYKMIAEKCNVSYSTVNSHITHIYEKLHVKSGTEAVAKAIENKIV
jgi:DNA-binding NarL/FixJ family response regulator